MASSDCSSFVTRASTGQDRMRRGYCARPDRRPDVAASPRTWSSPMISLATGRRSGTPAGPAAARLFSASAPTISRLCESTLALATTMKLTDAALRCMASDTKTSGPTRSSSSSFDMRVVWGKKELVELNMPAGSEILLLRYDFRSFLAAVPVWPERWSGAWGRPGRFRWPEE